MRRENWTAFWTVWRMDTRRKGWRGAELKEKVMIFDVSCFRFSTTGGTISIVVAFVALGRGWR